MMDNPWMVRRHVVRDEIEDKLDSPLGEFFPGNGQAFGTSQAFVYHVTSYAIGRPHVVFKPKIGKSLPKVF
jgi:hypothetical protein